MKAALIAAPLVLLAACGEGTADNTATAVGNAATMAESTVEDTAGAAVGMGGAMVANNNAGDYVANAALGDMYEIESSKLALEKSTSAEVKKFAQQMITDHTATSAQMKQTLAQAGLNLTPPASLDARRQGMLDNLRAASGAGFDRAYLDQQAAAHSEALTLHQGYAEEGDNDSLKRLAAETAPKIQHHFDMVRQIDAAGADGTS